MYKRILIYSDRNNFLPFDYKQEIQKSIESIGLNSCNVVLEFSNQKMLFNF